MKSKMKKLAALLAAAAVGASAITALCTTAVADNDPTEVVLLSSAGLANNNAEGRAAAYPSGAYGYNLWNNMNAAISGTTNALYSDAVKSVSYGMASSTPFFAATAWDDGVSKIDEERFQITPILNNDVATPDNENQVKFKDITGVTDFAASTISVDIARGSSYGNYNKDKIVGYRMGLAFVDYEAGSKTYTSGSTRYVYPTDIAWVDITSDLNMAELGNYASAKTFDELKRTVSVSVDDILTKGAHKRIHGATTDVTADNANAFVIGAILNDASYSCSGALMVYNNLKVLPSSGSAEEPTPAPEPEVTKTVLLSSAGLANNNAEGRAAAYPSGAYGYNLWNNMNAAISGATNALYSDAVKSVTYGMAASTPFYAATAWDDGVSKIDEERFQITPILNNEVATPNNENQVKFKDITGVTDFAASTLSVDIARGSSYGSYNKDKIVGYRMGLAYVDYEAGSKTYTSGSTRYVYPTDIAWVDITSDLNMADLGNYASTKTFDELKRTVSVSVEDILTKGTHKKIHGATTDVTADNANAFVIGAILNDASYSCSGALMVYNNLIIESTPNSQQPTETPTELPTEAPTEAPTETPTEAPTEAPTPVPTAEPVQADAAVYSDNGDGTYNVGLTFEALNPSKYANVVFKIGDAIKGAAVSDAFVEDISKINGDAVLGIILKDVDSYDVKAVFTNSALTYVE